MTMVFEELNAATRAMMLQELERELRGATPYLGKGLSAPGRSAFPDLMRAAVQAGDDGTLFAALNRADFWSPTEEYVRDGTTRTRNVNVAQTSERLASSEFNTWYVRGLSRLLKDQGIAKCQAYRAAQPKWEPGECQQHEGQIYDVDLIYMGHRARYWPVANPAAFSVPFGPGCHHTIRRYP